MRERTARFIGFWNDGQRSKLRGRAEGCLQCDGDTLVFISFCGLADDRFGETIEVVRRRDGLRFNGSLAPEITAEGCVLSSIFIDSDIVFVRAISFIVVDDLLKISIGCTFSACKL